VDGFVYLLVLQSFIPHLSKLYTQRRRILFLLGIIVVRILHAIREDLLVVQIVCLELAPGLWLGFWIVVLSVLLVALTIFILLFDVVDFVSFVGFSEVLEELA
jgi:hypothetical protein